MEKNLSTIKSSGRNQRVGSLSKHYGSELNNVSMYLCICVMRLIKDNPADMSMV